MSGLFDLKMEAERLLKVYGLFDKGWRFDWDKATSRGGVCNHRTRRITLSKAIFLQEVNQHNFSNVMLHEIAHALVGPGHGHDAVWKRKAREIGCDGLRCHSMETVKKQGRYAGSCGCGTDVHNKHRMTFRNGEVPKYRCNTCRTIVRWRIR